jgi:hypothetical protein
VANTVQNQNRIAWTYTDDAHNDWRVSAKQVYVEHASDGVKYGGAAAAGTVPHLRKGHRMRAVKCTSTGKPDKWIPAYETTAALFDTPGTTVTRDYAGADATYESTATYRGEKLPHGGITQAT